MAKSRILKKNDKAYLELPPEFGNCEEIEIVQVKNGGYFISAAAKKIDEIEIAVLQKLLSIRFEKRVPDHVKTVLTEVEQLILKKLEGKKFVTLYRSKKYPNGVYNIQNDIYPMISGRTAPKAPEPAKKTGILANGFLTLKDKNEAYKLSQKLSAEMKRGDVIGVKGFDGRFYVVTKQYLEKSQKAIDEILNGEKDVASIAKETNLDVEGCSAVLRLMAEAGDVLEKTKGRFAPV